MALLEINNYSLSLTCESGVFPVLDDISLSINRGEMVALVGESGCGKSMTAMSVLRLLPKGAVINSGEIIFDGSDLLKLNNKQIREYRGRRIALIPQDPMTSLNPLYTIGNQIIEGLQETKEDAVKKAIEVLDAVRIPDAKEKLDFYPHELSGGMKQRVIIGMALATDAELIIADEPTTALDVTIQAQIMNILDEIKRERKTSILLISHELNLVGQYSDMINVMYSGKIVESAPTDKFFEKTMHPYSLALLNALPANTPQNKRLVTIDGQPPNIQEKIEGCRFHPRCKRCIDYICNTKPPKLKEVYPEHQVRCYLYEI